MKDFNIDPFTHKEMVKKRWKTELEKYGKLIIAFDFDYTGTVQSIDFKYISCYNCLVYF